MKRTGLLAIALAATLAHADELDLSVPINTQIKTVDSDFQSAVHFIGPDITSKATAAGMTMSSDQLIVELQASRNKKTGTITYEAVLQAIYYGQWRFYESVSLVGGKTIAASSTQRMPAGCYRGSCQLTEAVFIPLSNDDVKAGLANGMRMQWNPKAFGTFEMEIPAAYFGAIAEAASR